MLVAIFWGESAGLSPVQHWTAAIVLLMIVWWISEPVPLWLTALIPIFFFPVLGISSLLDVVCQYFDPVNFLFLGGMLIAACMQQWGLHRRIALNVIDCIGVSPRRIVLGFMLATAFISMWISNTATAMMMYPIGMAVILKLRERSDHDATLVDRFGLALMLGVAYAASIGGIGTKIGTGPNLVFVRHAEAVLGRDVDFLTWLKVGLPIIVIVLPLVWFYLVRIAAPLPASGFGASAQVIRQEKSALGRMGHGEWMALVAFLAAAFLWIFRKDIELGFWTIPGWWRIVTWSWSDLFGAFWLTLPDVVSNILSRDSGDAIVAMAVGLSLMLIPVGLRPVRPALHWRELARIPWGLLALLGGGFAMAFGIQQSGLSVWMGEAISGSFQLSPLAMMFCICLLTVALTEVASNVATANILLPLIAASASQLPMHAAPLMFAATISASFGFMLPAGTPPNAIAFSSGYITVPQMARSGVLVDLFAVLLVAGMCYWLAPWALGV